MKATFPLKDGDSIETAHGTETVRGEITPGHAEPVCYTLQGNWYRRSDGERMTGWNGEVMTVQEFYRRRRTGEFDRHP